MKREDLKKLELSDDAIDAIMKLHGDDINKTNAKLETTNSELKAVQAQLADAGKQIEGFKGMKSPDEVEKAIGDWKTKLEQAEQTYKKQVSELKFDNALTDALRSANVHSPKAVKAMLNSDGLKFNESDSSIIGLDDQLKKLKESDAYLFKESEGTPRIVAGAQNQKLPSGDVSFTDAIQQRMANQRKT